MSDEIVYRLLTFLFLVANVSISTYFRSRAERQAGQLKTAEGTRLVVLLRLIGLAVIAPLLIYLVNPQWVAWARFAPPDWVRWLGALVAAGTVPLVYWTVSSLGNNISPTQGTRQNHQLVTHGPYQWIRHPLYTVGLLFALALTLLTAIWWTGIGMIVPITILLLRTRQEEANLVATFGDEYRAYQTRTRRFLPFVF
jgi:protein-S-isoprenylcysteine O-methyltransferase Ste14